jgi:hypothetical protein
MNEQSDAIVEILEVHGVALIKVASLLQSGHISAADVLAGITIATEELIALKALLAAQMAQPSSASTGITEKRRTATHAVQAVAHAALDAKMIALVNWRSALTDRYGEDLVAFILAELRDRAVDPRMTQAQTETLQRFRLLQSDDQEVLVRTVLDDPADRNHCPHGGSPGKCPVLGCANHA